MTALSFPWPARAILKDFVACALRRRVPSQSGRLLCRLCRCRTKHRSGLPVVQKGLFLRIQGVKRRRSVTAGRSWKRQELSLQSKSQLGQANSALSASTHQRLDGKPRVGCRRAFAFSDGYTGRQDEELERARRDAQHIQYTLVISRAAHLFAW